MGVKTTHTVYVYTEFKSTFGVRKNTQCNKITFHTHRFYFYTQCICIQNVLLLHPSSDLLHCVFLHTPSVLSHSVCSFTLFPRSIYAILSQNPFCLYLCAVGCKMLSLKILPVLKEMTNIRYGHKIP